MTKSPANDIQLGEDTRFQPGHFMSLKLNKTLTHIYNPHKNKIPMWVHRIFETLFGETDVPVFQGNFDYQYSVEVADNVPALKGMKRNTFFINGAAVDRSSEGWILHPYLLTIIKVEPSSWDEFFGAVESCQVPELENDHHDRVQSQLGRLNEVTRQWDEVKAAVEERVTVEELNRRRVETKENSRSLKNTRHEIKQTKTEMKEISRTISLMRTIAENDPQGVCQFQHFCDTGKPEQVDRSLDRVVSRTQGALDLARDEEFKLSEQVATSRLAKEKELDRHKRGKRDLEFKTAILNFKLGRYSPGDAKLPLYVMRFVKSYPLPLIPYEPSLLQLLAWNERRRGYCPVSVVLQRVTIKGKATTLQHHLLANILSQFSHTILVRDQKDERAMKRRLESIGDPCPVEVIAVGALLSAKGVSPVPQKHSILSLLNVEDELVWAFLESRQFGRIRLHPETWSHSSIVDIVGRTVVCSENSKFCEVTWSPTSEDFQDAKTLDCTLIDHLMLSDGDEQRCLAVWREKLDLEKAHLTHLKNYLDALNKDLTKHSAEHGKVMRAVPELAIKADVLERVSRDFRATRIENHREIEEREQMLKEKLAELRNIRGHHKRQRKWLRNRKESLLEVKSEFQRNAQYDELSEEELKSMLDELENEKSNLDEWKEHHDSGQVFRDTVCDFLARHKVSINPEIRLREGLARRAMVEVVKAMEVSVVFVDADFPEVEGKQIMVVEE